MDGNSEKGTEFKLGYPGGGGECIIVLRVRHPSPAAIVLDIMRILWDITVCCTGIRTTHATDM